jgi:hypothetical protein
MALTMGAVPHSSAQQSAPGSSPQEVAPAGEYTDGLAVNGWKVFPSLFVGAVYNTNVGQFSGTNDNGFSARAVPHVVASYDGGIHKTTLYGVVDAEFFNANTLAANAGITYAYQPMQDLTFNFYGNYTRETDLFNNAFNFNNGAIFPTAIPNTTIPIIINPFGTTPGVNPIAFNQFTGGASVTKTIDQFFVTLGGTAYYIAFDHPDSALFPFQTTHDGANYWITGRVGYHVTPQFYVFAEGDGVFQRFKNSLFDTNGYRVLGGIGSDDQQSLFRGEVYGGYQVQNQQNQVVIGSGIPTDVNSSVFGGRLTYFPTQYWTIAAQVDQTLGMSSSLSTFIPQGVPTKVTSAILQTNYGISRDWSVGARVGYSQGDFFGQSGLNNHAWMAGATFNYQIWRNLLLTLDYQYTVSNSNAPNSDFTNNKYTGGVTYRY